MNRRLLPPRTPAAAIAPAAARTVDASAPADFTPAIGVRVGDPEFRRISVALFAGGVATFALLYTPQPLLPLLSHDFHVAPGSATLTLSVTTLALGLGMLVAAAISDRVGRTPLMFGSLLAASVIALGTATAPTWGSLLALRLVEGLALAGLPSVAMAYLREEVHPEAHARATGLYVGGTAIGGMSGRIVSGLLADLGGWRWATAGIGALGLACAAVVITLLPRSLGFLPHGRASGGSLRRLLGPSMLPVYAIGGLLMGGFVAIYNAMSFRLAIAPYALSAGVAGLVFCVYPIGSFTSALGGRWADRIGRAQVVLVGGAVMALGVGITALHPLVFVVIGLGVMTGGFFAGHGVASGWVTARAQRIGAPVGMAASLYLFSYYLGSSVFGSLAGSLWSNRGWGAVTLMSLALIAISLGLAMVAGRYSPGYRAAATPGVPGQP